MKWVQKKIEEKIWKISEKNLEKNWKKIASRFFSIFFQIFFIFFPDFFLDFFGPSQGQLLELTVLLTRANLRCMQKKHAATFRGTSATPLLLERRYLPANRGMHYVSSRKLT